MPTLLACLLLLIGSVANAADDAVEATARVHADDTPIATPMATTRPIAGVTADATVYGRGSSRDLTGYLARPSGDSAPTAGLIVIHEWWGLNENIRGVTERLAGEGYLALAVDLYGGEVADNPKGAMSLMQGLQSNGDAANDNLRQAFTYLEEATGGGRIGVIGWCLGGRWSLNTALLLPDQIDAAVIYYGTIVTDPDRLVTLQMPIMGNFAENDPLIPLDSVTAFETNLRELGKEVDVKVYTGARHAFSNPSGQAYDAEAAADAWQRSTAFLDRHLR
ncbi:MAG: dienelactone hydrolase family protein [Gammaproteobacteria bacterium]|nr:dienelactone hydrolase family protein [Gammaproteobacteria bacterium]